MMIMTMIPTNIKENKYLDYNLYTINDIYHPLIEDLIGEILAPPIAKLLPNILFDLSVIDLHKIVYKLFIENENKAVESLKTTTEKEKFIYDIVKKPEYAYIILLTFRPSYANGYNYNTYNYIWENIHTHARGTISNSMIGKSLNYVKKKSIGVTLHCYKVLKSKGFDMLRDDPKSCKHIINRENLGYTLDDYMKMIEEIQKI